jgi:hypothetical protein
MIVADEWIHLVLSRSPQNWQAPYRILVTATIAVRQRGNQGNNDWAKMALQVLPSVEPIGVNEFVGSR